jgi:hypothetical protein
MGKNRAEIVERSALTVLVAYLPEDATAILRGSD